MLSTALTDKLTSSGAELSEYLGANAVASFGDPAAELRALLSGAAVSDLTWQAKLVITGEDRIRWTNGMVTNNIRDLAFEHGNYSFILNAQGKIQGDITVYNRGEYLLAVTSQSQVARMKEFLDRYIVMDDVEITDVSEKLASFGVAGPKAREVLTSAGFQVPALSPGEVANGEWDSIGYSLARGVLARDEQPETESFELWFAGVNAERIWQALVSAGAVAAGTIALEWLRILRGVPQYGADFGERELAQELNQPHALHFSKGCYIGQEIVERVHSRGSVHRGFSGFAVQGDVPALKSKIMLGDKQVGEVSSSASIPLPGGSRTFALGVVRREASAPGTVVSIEGIRATAATLPFQF